MGSNRDLAKRLREKGLLDASVTFVMCGDESKSKCASAKEMRAAWKTLKQGVKSRRKGDGAAAAAIRTRCFGVCKHGPIVNVQPEGGWYGNCDPDAIESILRFHLDGEPTRPPGRVDDSGRAGD